MPTYKVWVEIEEQTVVGDPDYEERMQDWDEYRNMGEPEEICAVDTLEKAQEIVLAILTLVGSDSRHTSDHRPHGETP